MQLRIAKLINQLLAVVCLLILGGGVGLFFLSGRYPELRPLFIGSFLVVSVLLMVIFRWFESGWDKKIITRMAQNGQIALANIKSGRRVMPMRDSAFTNYWLYEFQSELYDREHQKIEKIFYEKMNRDTGEIPAGSVYVTYDEAVPGRIFIVPNVMISHMPHLASIVQGYEEDLDIAVKYLDAYYNKGMVLKSFRETVPEQAARQRGAR